jgi:hypothetical protein
MFRVERNRNLGLNTTIWVSENSVICISPHPLAPSPLMNGRRIKCRFLPPFSTSGERVGERGGCIVCDT